MRYCSLSSSSHGGNAYLVEGCDGTRVLLDCGVRIRRLEAYLAEVRVAPGTLSALLMTHEHADHVAALRVRQAFPVKHAVPVYGSVGFWAAWDGADRTGAVPADHRRTVAVGETLTVGGLRIAPFAKPHDAADPIGYVVDDGQQRLAVLTDAGHVPSALMDRLAGCHHYVFESNHDPELERRSGRAPYLIARVLGRLGHLSNLQAAAALAELVSPCTRSVLLAHLSRDCNHPTLARTTVTAALTPRGYRGSVDVAPADRPSPWLPAGPVPAWHQAALAGL